MRVGERRGGGGRETSGQVEFLQHRKEGEEKRKKRISTSLPEIDGSLCEPPHHRKWRKKGEKEKKSGHSPIFFRPRKGQGGKKKKKEGLCLLST